MQYQMSDPKETYEDKEILFNSDDKFQKSKENVKELLESFESEKKKYKEMIKILAEKHDTSNEMIKHYEDLDILEEIRIEKMEKTKMKLKEYESRISKILESSEAHKIQAKEKYLALLRQFKEKLALITELDTTVASINKKMKILESENQNLINYQTNVGKKIIQLQNQVKTFENEIKKLNSEQLVEKIPEIDLGFLNRENYDKMVVEINAFEESVMKITKIIEALDSKQRIYLLTITEFLDQSLNQIEPQIKYYKNPFDPLLEAPQGNVTIVFTDIQGYSSLLTNNHEDMETALFLYNIQIQNILRDKKYNGYEVKKNKNSFFCAFSSRLNALDFALEVQLSFLSLPWPNSLSKLEECKNETGKNTIIFKGLRIKIGISSGEFEMRKENDTIEYKGPIVDLASALVSKSEGGMILTTSEFWDSIKPHLHEIKHPLFVKDLGEVDLKEIKEKKHLMVILPEQLKERISYFE
jgi:class 3 adenylate cyclase